MHFLLHKKRGKHHIPWHPKFEFCSPGLFLRNHVSRQPTEMSQPPEPTTWEGWQALVNEPAKQGEAGVPKLYMAAYGTVCALALGGGALAGSRSFEDTAAFEALDKLEKPTVAAERQAMRLATRAFGIATGLCAGSAVAAVMCARAMGVRVFELAS